MYFVTSAILIMLCVLSSEHCRAQSAEPFNFYGNITPSVESFSMIQYGKEQPSLYTGAMNYSLPLYTYHDEDFTLPISLEYHFDGFKPAQCSGTVGYGWSLNCGGVITREVRGLPDEYHDFEGDRVGYFRKIIGSQRMLHPERQTVMNNKIPVPFPQMLPHGDINNSVIDDMPLFADSLALEGDRMYDTSADIFHFSFLGRTGSFMMKENGQFIIFGTNSPHGEFSIILNFDADSLSEVQAYSFEIRTGDGFRYLFGENRDAIEYSVSSINDDRSIQPAGWWLSSIIAPSGKRMTFHYPLRGKENRIDQIYTPAIQYKYVTDIGESHGSSQSQKKSSVVSLLRPLLDSICVDGHHKILLSYCGKSQEEVFNLPAVDFDRGLQAIPPVLSSALSRRLSSISVCNTDADTVEFVSLAVQYNSFSGKMFLTGTNSRSAGRYSFAYNLATNEMLPPNDTEKTDYWGYWNNGGIADLRLVPIVANSGLYNQLSGTAKDPDYARTVAGALTEITYPTGGKAGIFYEQNSAGKVVDRSLTMRPHVRDDITPPIGGVRVKKITYSCDGYQESDYYRYKFPNGADSGILLWMPRYAMYCEANILTAAKIIELKNTGYSYEGSYNWRGQSHIGYSLVRIHHPDDSYIDYRFIDYEMTPDNYDVYTEIPKTGAMYDYSMEEEDYYHNLLLPPSVDYGGLRGRIRSISEYLDDGTLRRKTDYQYRTELTDTCSIFVNSISRFFQVPYRGVRVYQISETISEYEDEIPKEMSAITQYNAQGQKSYESSFDPVSQSGHAVYTRYAHETDTSALKICPAMIVHTAIRGSTKYITSVDQFTYDAQWRHSFPLMVRRTEWDMPPTLSQNPFDISFTGGYSRSVNLTYDNWFRLIQAVGSGGRTLSYTWDAGGQHIIRKSGSHPADVTLYNWKDLIGLTDQTDPTGIATHWEYDEKGRLHLQKNSLGQRVVQYNYHLNHE